MVSADLAGVTGIVTSLYVLVSGRRSWAGSSAELLARERSGHTPSSRRYEYGAYLLRLGPPFE